MDVSDCPTAAHEVMLYEQCEGTFTRLQLSLLQLLNPGFQLAYGGNEPRQRALPPMPSDSGRR